MTDKVIESNNVTVYGTVTSKPEFSHEMYGEGFYTVYLEVPRLSDISDTLPITISERLVQGLNIDVGSTLLVEGQLRSYNKYHEGNNKLILTVFARNLKTTDQDVKNPNQIYLDGYICKKPVYRTTPFGREITDMLLAVNRPYNKSDYIPCIAWGRNARYSENLKVGDRIRIWGRIQSRDYQKKISEDEVITRTAYEVSISKMEVFGGETEEKKDNSDEEPEE
ncbi:MAG TPA: single-stranded DNA-binding protein [Bacillota bacterium]|jgi:single-stranded DNA-binding protein|nr:single-stranded DNA-binding protein [Bacillota bacterium]HQL36595.1 single-stranded DNA-binding protein [Bacillota bacterium]HRS20861.1 single-stranded DNA-binding protein [Clostridia bacterium]HRU40782.1 single-stranded DNA-binding protein [Candidatus Diapherotrites archaeon]